jgi:hypothetical protein
MPPETNGHATRRYKGTHPDPSQRVYSTGMIATILKVAPRTVSKWIDAGKLKGYRIPCSLDRRVSAHDLMDFMRKYDFPASQITQVEGLKSVAVYCSAVSDYETSPFEAGWLAGEGTLGKLLVGTDFGLEGATAFAKAVRKRSQVPHVAILLADDLGYNRHHLSKIIWDGVFEDAKEAWRWLERPPEPRNPPPTAGQKSPRGPRRAEIEPSPGETPPG